jgi:hypothetical protein
VVFQPEGAVLFWSLDEAHNPRLALAIFHSTVVGLILEEKAAIFHGKSSGNTIELSLRG